MGCVSSKVITRSSSYHQEAAAAGLNQLNYFQRRDINGFVPSHGLAEELLISKNGGTHGDQLLALAACCNVNTVDKSVLRINHHTGSSQSEDSIMDLKPLCVDPINPETMNSPQTIMLMAGPEQHGQAELQQQQQSDIVLQSTLIEGAAPTDINRRSKSFHSITEGKLSLARSLDSHVTDKRDSMVRGLTRSRSYRTLEEYEVMVEKKRQSESHQVHNIDDSITHKEEVPSSSSYHCGNLSNTLCSSGKNQENVQVEVVNDWATAERGVLKNGVLEHVVPAAARRRLLNISHEKGLRRKAMAKELKSLSIPSCNTIELFPAAAAIGTRTSTLTKRVASGTLSIRDEQVVLYSSSETNYVTPKFGSFCLLPAAAAAAVPTNKQRKIEVDVDSDDHHVFESEMVSAFEEAMHQLQVEEDCILKQINGES